MEKVLLFIYNDMADFEVVFATHLLGGDLGKEIITIGYDSVPVTSKSGVSYLPKITFKEYLSKKMNADGILIPGGWNGEVQEELLQVIRQLHHKKAMIAAICAGPRFLTKAGILNDVKYTTTITKWTDQQRESFGEEDPFPRENFVDQRVLRDGHVITSKGMAFIDFAIEIIDYLDAFDDEDDRKNFIAGIKGF